MLQISSYWREAEEIVIDLAPDGGLFEALRTARADTGRVKLKTELARHLPQRLVDALPEMVGGSVVGNLGDQSDAALQTLVAQLRDWRLKPAGTEGYRTAEVTLGGVDTDGLSSQTMEARGCAGLYVIGEAVDVTGWLGGYNFQWAWASGMAAARAIKAGAASQSQVG